MKEIKGGVTAAKGFQAASAAAEIKYKGRTDMAMIFSSVPCKAAGTFTTNIVKAAPVKWDQKVVYEQPYAQAVICNSGIANACTGEEGYGYCKETTNIVKAAPVKWDQKVVYEQPYAQAVICNSGIANACTGEEGYGYCKETADAAAEILNISPDSVLVASTGVIGMQVPIEKIKNGIKMMVPALSGEIFAGTDAAKAIMTTDTVHKEVAVEIEIGGKAVTIGGMCKGSGMIHPNMCTMLGFVTTDISISKELLLEALKEDVKDTYNMISVDGDTSTNDTVLLLANGMAGNEEITEKNADYEKFKMALNYVNSHSLHSKRLHKSHKLFVYFCENHFRNFHCIFICHTKAVDKLRLHTHLTYTASYCISCYVNNNRFKPN